MSNPFNKELDWALRGKYARVRDFDTNAVFEGWIERVHHDRGSVVMHDCTDVSGDTNQDVGSVFIRIADSAVVLKPRKQIEFRSVESLQPHPDYNIDFEPKDRIVRSCYRNQFAGAYPVISEDGTIINGHKRIAAAEMAGMEKHPVEVIDVTNEQASELFQIAHPNNNDDNANEDDSDSTGEFD